MSEYEKERVEWRNRFQPEETGLLDGENGMPGQGDPDSEWEGRVREAVQHRLADIAREFSVSEGILATKYQRLKAQLQQLNEVAVRQPEGAPIPWFAVVPIPGAAVVSAVALLLLAVAVFLGVLVMPVIGNTALAIVVAGLGAVALGSLCYVAGLLLHANKSALARVAAAVLVGTAMALVVFAGYRYGHGNPDQLGLGIVLGGIGALTLFAIMACAYYLTHPQYQALRARREIRRINRELAELGGQRRGNREVHIDRAQVTKELGDRLIMTYRENNCRKRKIPAPEFFNAPPAAGTVNLDEFSFQGDNDVGNLPR